MKKYIVLIFLLYSLILLAQTSGFVVNVDKASTTYLTWKVPGDYTGYDSLHFVVKACTTSSSCGQLIKKNCGVTFANPYSTLTCTLYVDETASFNAAKYYFSIYAYGVDTVAVRSGTFNLQLNGQTPTDGIATATPYYTIALDTPNTANTFIVGQDSNNVWYRKTPAQVQTILGIDTLSGGLIIDLDSLYTKTSHIINVKEFGATGDGVTNDNVAIQSAIIATSAGSTLFFPEGEYLTSGGFQINKPIRILGVGKESKIKMTDPNTFQVLFYMGGSVVNGTPYPDFAAGTSHTFGGILRKGQSVITGLSNTTGLTAGDEVYLALGVDTIDTGQNAFRMFNRIKSVDGVSQVTLEIPIPEDVDSTFYPLAWVFAPKTHVLHEYTIQPSGFEIGNLSIEFESGVQNDAGIIMYRMQNGYIHDLFLDRTQTGSFLTIGESENVTIERIYTKRGNAVGVYGSRNVSARDVFIEKLYGAAIYLEAQNRQFSAENFTIQYGSEYPSNDPLFIGGNSKSVHLKNFTFISDSLSNAVIHLTGLDENNVNDIITENFSFYGDTGAVKVFPLKQHTGILNYNGYVVSKTKHYRKTIDITSGLNGSIFDLAKGVIKDFKVKLTNRGTSTNGVSIIQVNDTANSRGTTILDYGNVVDLLPADGVYGYLTTDAIDLIGSSYPLNDDDGMKSITISTAGTVPDSCELVIDIEYYYLEDDGVGGVADSELPLKLNETDPDVYGFLSLPADFTINADSSVGIAQLGGAIWMRDSTGNYITFETEGVTFTANPDLVTNGNFAAWTANDPDNWTIPFTEDANDYINEIAGAVKMVSTDSLVQMYQAVCTVGEVYQYSITIDTITTGYLILEGGMPLTNLRTVGTHNGMFTASAANVFITRGVYPTDVVFDDFSISVLPRYNIVDEINSKQSPINLLNPTVDDTVFIGRFEKAGFVDSIRVFDILDSIAIQLFYRTGTDNNLITTVDTLTTDTTIAFDTTTIPANSKVYMYVIYVGDSEAYIRSELYWRKQ